MQDAHTKTVLPTGTYIYSDITLNHANNYLSDLKSDINNAGVKLIHKLAAIDLSSLSAEQLLMHLMNTRKPQIYAEREPFLNGNDWNETETNLLGGISFSTFKTSAYNSGGHYICFKNFNRPQPVNLLYVAGTLFRNDKGNTTYDINYVLKDGEIQDDKLLELYEQRLLPGLIAQNNFAKSNGKKLIINIPGLGCGQFAGVYKNKINIALPKALKSLLEKHSDKLKNVSMVYYDSYEKIDGVNYEESEINGINFICCYSQGIANATALLEFPNQARSLEDFNEEDYLILKVVAWDHFSFPGNDIWADSRATDDGVSAASTNTIEAMVNMGQFGELDHIKYNYNKDGVLYPSINKKIVRYEDFSKNNPYNVSENMLKMIPTDTHTLESGYSAIYGRPFKHHQYQEEQISAQNENGNPTPEKEVKSITCCRVICAGLNMLINFIYGTLALIPMLLGMFICRGFANKIDREWFFNSFLSNSDDKQTNTLGNS